MKLTPASCSILVFAVALFSNVQAEPAGVTVVTVSGGSAPVPAGAAHATFLRFRDFPQPLIQNGFLDPVIDDLGRVTFVAEVSDTGEPNGIYQGTDPNQLQLVVRQGMEEEPGFSYGRISKMRASDSGHVAFTDNASLPSRILRWHAAGGIQRAISAGGLYLQDVHLSARSLIQPEYYVANQPASVFQYFTHQWRMNDLGDLLVTASMRTIYQRSDPLSYYKSKEWGGLLAVPAFDGNSSDLVFVPGLVLDARLEENQPWQFSSRTQLYNIGDDSDWAMSDSSWTGRIAYEGQNLPPGTVESGNGWTNLVQGRLTSPYGGTIAAHGEMLRDQAVFFNSWEAGLSNGFANIRSDDQGNITFIASVKRLDGVKELRAYARHHKGETSFEPMPRGLEVAGHGTVEISGYPENGRWAGNRVIQKVQLTGAVQAIVSRKFFETPVLVAVQGEMAPGGFALQSLGLPSVNGLGNVAFLADLMDGGGKAIFFKAVNGTLKRMVATGDAFLGSTVADLRMFGEALNGRDQILFDFTLADGRTGLAIADGDSTYRTWVAGYTLAGEEVGPLQDPDGDGSTNQQEFEDGTDPTDPNSLVRRLAIFAESGSVAVSPDKTVFMPGESATLTATAPDGLVFHAWDGDASGNLNPITLAMNRSRQVSAIFLTPFESWIRGFGLEPGQLGLLDDPDGDLVNNATEFDDQTDPSDPASAKLFLMLSTTGEGSVSAAPAHATYDAGAVVQLLATPDPGRDFLGWSGDASGSQNPLSLTMNGNKTVVANFGLGLATALDTPGRQYVLGGNGQWSGQTTTTHDGVDAGQSGQITHNQQTWFETTVSGAGNLSFWWKVSSESGYDFLEFYINGSLQSGRISGNVNWQQKTYSLAAGSHVLRWRYMKDSSFSSGSDKGWVDEVQWVPDSPLGSWAAAAGLTGDDALPLATPHHDGVANLLKFAFNMNGGAPDNRVLVSGTGSAGLPAITQQGAGASSIFRIEFVRRIGSGLVYTPKKSPDLTPGSWIPLTDVPIITPIDGTWERVVYEEPVDTSIMPHCFGAVEVALP